MAQSAADLANQQLVDRLIALGALWSRPLIDGFRRTPRHRFLDRVYQFHRKSERWGKVSMRQPGPGHLRLIYSDRALITRLSPAASGAAPVPISSSSQPSLMAQMLEDLDLSAGQRTLEVGAGTGYNAALLAHVVGPARVVSVDVDRQVLAEAARHLTAFAERRVELRHADGRSGCPGGGPYDRIMVTAATPEVEPAWVEQLAEGGVLLAPLAVAPGLAFVLHGRVAGGTFEGRLTRAAYFMPLRAEDEPGTPPGDGPSPTGAMQTVAAPWAGWFDRRRPRPGWLGLAQSLAFFGWLRGLTVSYLALADGQPAYGLSDAVRGCGCWFGLQSWQATGEAGRELGEQLWRAFLDAGGPWPTEYRLLARGDEIQRLGQKREVWWRGGQRWPQAWELVEKRERQTWI